MTNTQEMKLWWKCPNCKEKVDFVKEMEFVFDEDGEADFDPEKGLYFNTIECECGAEWTMSIGKMEINIIPQETVSLERGDKIRRKSDGKLFTYTGKDDSGDDNYGCVKEMAVPVYLPDFEKVESTLFPESNPFLDKLNNNSIKDEKHSFESESNTDRDSK